MFQAKSFTRSTMMLASLLMATACGTEAGSSSLATAGGDGSRPAAGTGAGPAAVKLGTAGTFAILSKSGITDVYASAITGDVGTLRRSPGPTRPRSSGMSQPERRIAGLA